MAGTTAIKKFVNYFWGESDADMEPETEQAETINNEVYGYEEEPETMGGIEGINPFKRKSKIVSMPQPQQIKMKISKPTNFDQVDEIINQLKEKNEIIDILFLDPPYIKENVYQEVCDFLFDNNLLSNNAIIVKEWNKQIPIDNRFNHHKSYSYGTINILIERR